MKNIHIKTCPICGKKLNNYFTGVIQKFYCNDFFYRRADWEEINGPTYDKYAHKVREPHYSVVLNSNKDTWYQNSIILPYQIVTDLKTERTSIYKFPRNLQVKVVWPINLNAPKFDADDLIMEIPMINPSDYLPEAFAKKIHNLVLFS